jgi:hypothetical protein
MSIYLGPISNGIAKFTNRTGYITVLCQSEKSCCHPKGRIYIVSEKVVFGNAWYWNK